MLKLLERNISRGSKGWYDDREYCKVYDTETKRVSRILYYRFVWIEKNGDIPEGMVIHHIDGDKNNNDISNLILMDSIEHARLHSESKLGKTYEEIYGFEKGSEMRAEKSKTFDDRFGDRSLDIRNKMSQSMLGKNIGPKSEETKQKISIANTGNIHTEEWKQQQSERSRELWKNTEYAEKIVSKTRGLKRSDETRRRISEAKLGKSKSEETKRKLSELNAKFTVTDKRTGQTFNGLKAAAREYGVDKRYFARHPEFFEIKEKA